MSRGRFIYPKPPDAGPGSISLSSDGHSSSFSEAALLAALQSAAPVPSSSPVPMGWPPAVEPLLYGASTNSGTATSPAPTRGTQPRGSRKPNSNFSCPFCRFTQTRQNVQRHVNKHHMDMLTEEDRIAFVSTGGTGLLIAPDGETRVDMCLACDCIPGNHSEAARAKCIKRFTTGASAVDKRNMSTRVTRPGPASARAANASAEDAVTAAAALASIAYEPEADEGDAGGGLSQHAAAATSDAADAEPMHAGTKRRREDSSGDAAAAHSTRYSPPLSMAAAPDEEHPGRHVEDAMWAHERDDYGTPGRAAGGMHTHTHTEVAPPPAPDDGTSVTLNVTVPGHVLESLSRRCARLAEGERLLTVALVCVDAQGRVSLLTDSLANSSEMVLPLTRSHAGGGRAASPDRFSMLSQSGGGSSAPVPQQQRSLASSVDGMDDDGFVSWEVMPLSEALRQPGGPPPMRYDSRDASAPDPLINYGVVTSVPSAPVLAVSD